MKKALIVAALISGLTISTGAFASHGMSGGGHMGGMGGMGGPGFVQRQLDPEVQAKIDQFYKDTQNLRRQMVVKRAEKKAMMKRTDPDPAAVGQLAGELFDLHATMVQKAKEAGVEQYVGHGNRQRFARQGCMNFEHGRKHGGHGHGHNDWHHGEGHQGYHHDMQMQMQMQNPADQI